MMSIFFDSFCDEIEKIARTAKAHYDPETGKWSFTAARGPKGVTPGAMPEIKPAEPSPKPMPSSGPQAKEINLEQPQAKEINLEQPSMTKRLSKKINQYKPAGIGSQNRQAVQKYLPK